jgi:hypothetical protein
MLAEIPAAERRTDTNEEEIKFTNLIEKCHSGMSRAGKTLKIKMWRGEKLNFMVEEKGFCGVVLAS